jgi:hypothetical protein
MPSSTPPPSPTNWSHLPNANHIDRIISDFQSRPELWKHASIGFSFEDPDNEWFRAWDIAYLGLSYTKHHYLFEEIINSIQGIVSYSVQGAILAIIVWPDSDRFLTMRPDQVEFMGALLNQPASTLLLPAVVILNITY